MVTLGATGIRVGAVGVGAWSWGDRCYWGYGRSYGIDDVREAFDESLRAGATFFDTAELYGFGRSERILGGFVRELSPRPAREETPIVATKYLPVPWRPRTRKNLLRALRRSLERLGFDEVDLYQVHWPIQPTVIGPWADGLAAAFEAGLVRSVGVSNYSVEQMWRTHEALAKRGIPLASNQVAYSLLDRGPELNGVLDACRELGVTLIAYSPLAEGLLTGKFRPGAGPSGYRGWRMRNLVRKVQPIVEELRVVGAAHGGKTPGQVALRWLVAKGALPIPGAKNANQARENAGAMGWSIDEEAVARLEEVADRANG
jgi:aryl-alcohol dehydrogenase-like predicted oxidoreductase